MLDLSSVAWRHENMGRHLNHALSRFEARVLELIEAAGFETPRKSYIHLTRNLDLAGTGIGDLAERAGMTKQSMSELVEQSVAAGLVRRVTGTTDRRSRIVKFTPRGLALLEAFRGALARAEAEMRAEVGAELYDAARQALAAYGQAVTTLTKDGDGDE
jgi:DNA-binding MarR family transcriptional regulator